MGEITITSTSDTAEQVSQALGITPDTPAAPDTPVVAGEAPDTPDADEPADAAETPDVGADADPEADDDEEAARPLDPDVSQAGRTLAQHQTKSQRRIQALRGKIAERDRSIQELKQQLQSAAPPAAATGPAATETPAPLPAAVLPPVVVPPVIAPPVVVPPPGAALPPLAVVEEQFSKPMPKDDDFADFEALQQARVEWMQEWTDWRLAKADRDREIRAREDQARHEAQVAQQHADEARRTRIEAVKQKLPDFDTVMASTQIQLPHEVLARLGTDPVGMEMAYHIATHPELAAKFQIAGQTVAQVLAARDAAFVELGVLRAQIEAGTAPKAALPLRLVPGVSKAPEPMTRASGASTPASKSPDKMDQQEYKLWRASGGGR